MSFDLEELRRSNGERLAGLAAHGILDPLFLLKARLDLLTAHVFESASIEEERGFEGEWELYLSDVIAEAEQQATAVKLAAPPLSAAELAAMKDMAARDGLILP